MGLCTCVPASIDGRHYIQWIGTYFGDCVRTLVEIASFYFGLGSTVCFIFALVPQIVHNYKRKSCEGLSVGLIFMWTVADLTNYAGTLLSNQLPTQRLTAIYFLATDVALWFQFVYYTRYYVGDGENEPLIARHHEEDVATSAEEIEEATRPTNTEETHARLSNWNKVSVTVQLLSVLVPLVVLDNLLGRYSRNGHSDNDDRVLCDGIGFEQEGFAKVFGAACAWISGLFYFTARVPQIIMNYRSKSTEALSLALFLFTIFGNLLYSFSIVIRLPEIDEHFWKSTFPYIVGSFGTILFDFVVVYQKYLYS